MEYSIGSAKGAEIRRFQLRRGDVLITKDSETSDDIGIPSLVADELPNTICGYHLALIRPNRDINPVFLCHYLQGEQAKRHFLRNAAGATRFGLNLRAISRLPFPEVENSEQAAIARILDAVDRTIDQAQLAVIQAEEFDHSLLPELLESGVGRTRQEKRPAHWQLKRIDEVAAVGSGVTLGRDVTGYKSVELPYLRVANVQDGHLDLSTIKTVRVPCDEVDRYRLEPGDVLMTEGGDLDKLGRGTLWEGQIADCLHQNHIFRVRADRSQLDPRYLALVVESDMAKRYFTRVAKRTTNLASTNKTQVRAFRFLLPPLEEQQQIADTMSASKATIRALQGKAAALQKLKKSLMHDLLTGIVRVTDGDLTSSP
jgi:type I restriction enzyme, S subunit